MLGDIRAGLDAVQGDLDILIRGATAVLGLLPEPVAAAAAAQIGGGIGEPFRLTRDKLDRLLALAGSPGSVAAAATTGLAVMVADDKWSGPAAEAYRAVIPLQTGALTSLTTAATEINTTLHDYAAALESFWLSIGFAVAALGVAVAALAVGLLLAETVLGAIAAGIVAVGAFITAVEKPITAFATFSSKRAADVAVLTNRLYNDSAFPDRNWPVPTNDLRDAGITDGDGTDWSLEP